MTSLHFLQNICRTCATEDNNLNVIEGAVVSVGNSTVSVLELLNMLTAIEINGYLPDTICLDCLKKLTDIYEFILQCNSANIILNQQLEERTKTKKYSNEVKDELFDTKMGNIEGNINVGTESVLNNEISFSKIDVKLCEKSSEISKISNDLFICNVCNISFEEESILDLHKKHHQKQKEKFGCKMCKRKYNSKRSLNKHIRLIHEEFIKGSENADITEEISTFICGVCNKSFKSKYILTVHEKRHLHKGQFLCTICGKGFNSKGCLNRHMRVHTGEKKYECNICKKKFPSSNNLNLHSRIHSGVKPYLCTICGKSFTHPTGLTYHIRTHTKEKKYKCDICGKSFAIQCHLDNHRKIHTGERPYPCSQCDKAFIKKVDLQRHEAVHAGIKPHICGVCDKEFLRPLHLNYHMMIHTDERPHKCEVCGKGFIRRYYLKDHMIKHHGFPDSPRVSDNKNINL